MAKKAANTALPYPRSRLLMVDGGRLGRKKHTIHGLVEFDISCARRILADEKAQTGKAHSFSAFLLVCLGQAVAQNRELHAYRNWRNQLIVFDDVDVNTLFEVNVAGRKMIRPHIIRGVNRRSVEEIHQEIRTFQQGHEQSREARFVRWFVHLPGFVRRGVLAMMFKNPHWIKESYGTVLLTAIGMFGEGGGWGIPVSNHTLQVTVGGIGEKPLIVDGRIETRETLSVTLTFDHDVVDGAPAARFTQRFRELVESGYGLDDINRQSRQGGRMTR